MPDNLTPEATDEVFRGMLLRAYARAGGSPRAFAAQVGVSRTALNRYLNGERGVPFHVLVNALLTVGGVVNFSCLLPLAEGHLAEVEHPFQVIEGGKK